MHTKLITSTMVALFATAAVFTAAPASAQRGDDGRQRQVERYCAKNPGDRDCRRYRDGRRSDETLGSLFGKAGRAVVGGARTVGQTIENTACDARYKSYDRRTNTYRGRDGRRYRCD
ncbi:BA14K family protein [Terrihabitans rhizophilus]|uniref:Lectin-like protein BA14k n=1 Tax=Terrihabitans rhizophilus TaxID=3092662 RepID=A0ABU4RTR6_9HYPH|nr:BA14K family protein [Terrihabitans sp. PJ23]MDX6807030.1 BA14K family protein [Terrihabitans sp. PJ23]